MSALVSFWNSERGLLAVVLIVCATVLAALSAITAEQWLDYSKWIFTAYVAGKTATGVVEALKSSPSDKSNKGDAS